VSLRAAARVEVLLPPGSPYQVGDRVPLWLFDPSDGFWREQAGAVALVLSSTTTPGRLAALGFVTQPGWWNVDRAVEVACLSGRVEDARGLPVEGALVTATGLDHFALASARSAEDGSYCVQARRGSRVALRASAVVDGLRLDSAPAELTTPDTASPCAEGGCGMGPVLALPDVSCVCGQARDELGQPRPGVRVVTSAGSAATTDADGRYCLGAPAEQTVAVFGEGYEAASVETPGPVTCPSGCAVLDLVPPVAQAACVSGRVVDDATGLPLAGAAVEGRDGNGVPYGPPVQADDQGLYTLGGLPVDASVRIRAVLGGLVGLLDVTTGTEPGEPGSAACAPVPDVRCVGPS
jgi:hypothetical protein